MRAAHVTDRWLEWGDAVLNVDEGALEIPGKWSVLPRRRDPVQGRVKGDFETAARQLRPLAEGDADWGTAALDDPGSEPRLVEAARAQLAGEPTLLGTAALVAIQGFGIVPDGLALEHGLPFAAEVLVEGCDIEVRSKPGPDGWKPGPIGLQAWARHPGGRTVFASDWSCAAKRLRTLLAFADEPEYRAAVAALAGHRRSAERRIVVSYLVPSETAWVDECCADLPALERGGADLRTMLLCSLGTPEQVAALGELAVIPCVSGIEEVLATMADGIGPAVAPLLTRLIKYPGSRFGKPAVELLGRVPSDEAFQMLLDGLGKEGVRPGVAEFMRRFPARAMRVLPPVAAGGSQKAAAARRLLDGHMLAHPDLAAAEGLTVEVVVEAGSLPAALVTPSWLRASKEAPDPVVIPGLKAPSGENLVWEPGEREKWAATRGYWTKQTLDDHKPHLQNYLAGRLAYPGHQIQLFGQGPEKVVRPLLADWNLKEAVDHSADLMPIVARYELDARPAAFRAGKRDGAGNGWVLLPFLDAEVTRLMADRLARVKSARRVSDTYFRRHGLKAVPYLVPDAFGKRRTARDGALEALRLIASMHGPEQVVDAAREHGDEVAAALPSLLAVQESAPDGVPDAEPVAKIGRWVDVARLPRVRLREGGTVLPLPAARHLVGMLSLSALQEHPDLKAARDVCDPASLAEFGWALLEQWQAARLPSPLWPLEALRWIGDDETVRRLAPVIAAWPGESGHTRAVRGLWVLAGIGTEVALLKLDTIARRSTFKGLKKAAQETVRQVADRLGLSEERLADRLVPGLGLDAEGTAVLDYGPRRFTVGFDEQLRPLVWDEKGRPRRSLPAPGVRDDAVLAPTARRSFTELKKDVRAVAGDQIRRLESAMVAQRRWTAAEFRRFLVGHPLMWHLARRLVWVSGTAGFRLAEDRTFADVNDEAIALPDDAEVGIVHPVHLPAAALGAWSELFADYQILQPFPQLGRAVHALTEDECAGGRLTRFEDVPVPTGKVLGLTRGAWERGTPEDGGVETRMTRPLPGGLTLVADLDPGIVIGLVDHFPEQRLRSIALAGRGETPPTFGDLDPVTASELLTELTGLTTP
ncbi:DUF4132 domain-containing protein [Actinomadura xylanilytica]|uniref:DUF4132 domain-containing protein n=1 Tax=Actinomadura xylanilytica TaxID=887459 RepID=UPI00255ADB9D|nr:DUF4132 domain-containing protein [Actinomadura xylanilytica]